MNESFLCLTHCKLDSKRRLVYFTSKSEEEGALMGLTVEELSILPRVLCLAFK